MDDDLISLKSITQLQQIEKQVDFSHIEYQYYQQY